MSRQTTPSHLGFKKAFRTEIVWCKVQFFPFCWLVLPFRERSNLIRLKHKIVLYLQMFQHKIISILFQISALALFLKYSENFANFSLDILIKYILMKKECNMTVASNYTEAQQDLGTKLTNIIGSHAYTWKNRATDFKFGTPNPTWRRPLEAAMEGEGQTQVESGSLAMAKTEKRLRRSGIDATNAST